MSDKPTQGQQDAVDAGSKYNAMAFMMQQILSRVNVATLVQVLACSNAGGVSPIGTVDVQVLVNQLDGAGNAVPHVTVFGLPYFRLQGGTNAVILDPQVGDIGAAVFSHHDISGVKAAKGQANPGSLRRNSIADGMYFGSLINAAPVQYVRFSTDGIDVVSPTKVTVTTPEMDVNVTTFNLQASGSVTINSPSITIEGGGTSIDGKPFLPHEHSGVSIGAANTQGVV